jgi:hypothetical protein
MMNIVNSSYTLLDKCLPLIDEILGTETRNLASKENRWHEEAPQ